MIRKLPLMLEILRAEGILALRDRALDHFAELRRRRALSWAHTRLQALGPAVAAVGGARPILQILSSPPVPWLGGVATQLRARLRIEARHRPVALLYPDLDEYRLELLGAGREYGFRLAGSAVRDSRVLADREFEKIVRTVAEALQADGIHVESPAGLPLESLLRLAEASESPPILLSVHDFSLFCRRPHLLERPGEAFCEYCRNPERCTRCLRETWDVSGEEILRHRKLGGALLERTVGVVYPSSFLRDRHRELFAGHRPPLESLCAPASEAPRLPYIERRREQGLRVAFLGGGHVHKGAKLFEELVRRESKAGVSWRVYGGGNRDVLRRLRRLPKVRVRGYYRAGALPGLLSRDRTDLALILSTVPETFSLAFSECLAARIPVLATARGALCHRVVPPTGRLVPPDEGVDGISRRLADFRLAPSGSEAETLWPKPPRPEDAAASMMALYERLGWR